MVRQLRYSPKTRIVASAFLRSGEAMPGICAPFGGTLSPKDARMSAAHPLPRPLRPRREVHFGQARGIPLDRNAKSRIMATPAPGRPRTSDPDSTVGRLRGRSSTCCEPFSRSQTIATGACSPPMRPSPSGRFAAAIPLRRPSRRLRRPRLDLGESHHARGSSGGVRRILRTSNAYVFRDPMPCADRPDSSKSENPTGPGFRLFLFLPGSSSIPTRQSSPPFPVSEGR